MRKTELLKIISKPLKTVFPAVALMFCLCACGGDSKIILTTGFMENELFRIDGLSCDKSEYMVYLTNIQDQYESAYGSSIWTAGNGGVNLGENLRQTVLARLAKIKMMNRMAESYKLTLSQEEKKKAEDAAKSYFSSLSDEEKEAMGGVTEKTIRNMYEEYALASRLYEHLTEGVDVEVSDDEARTVTLEQICCEERAEAEEALRRLEGGESFDVLAMSGGTTELIRYVTKDGEEDDDITELCFALGEGETSSVVEDDGKFYIFKCLSTFDREQTDLKKKKIAEKRLEEAFNETYDSFAAGKRCYLNEELFEEISFAGGGSVDTADFFDVYENTFAAGF